MQNLLSMGNLIASNVDNLISYENFRRVLLSLFMLFIAALYFFTMTNLINYATVFYSSSSTVFYVRVY